VRKCIPSSAVLIPDSAKKVFSGIIFDTYQWQQGMFNDSNTTFEMLKRPDTVTAICVVDDKILILDEEQPHAGSSLGFPGGRVDSGDGSTLNATQREVDEETGYSFSDWKLLKVWQPHKKIEWFVYLYLACGEYRVEEPHIDEGEKINIKFVDFEEVSKLSLNKAGYLGDAEDIFKECKSLPELVDYSEFQGQEVDR
jgi:8-oxo-dGTP pyrophosphatase MutT (NUDIX family)